MSPPRHPNSRQQFSNSQAVSADWLYASACHYENLLLSSSPPPPPSNSTPIATTATNGETNPFLADILSFIKKKKRDYKIIAKSSNPATSSTSQMRNSPSDSWEVVSAGSDGGSRGATPPPPPPPDPIPVPKPTKSIPGFADATPPRTTSSKSSSTSLPGFAQPFASSSKRNNNDLYLAEVEKKLNPHGKRSHDSTLPSSTLPSKPSGHPDQPPIFTPSFPVGGDHRLDIPGMHGPSVPGFPGGSGDQVGPNHPMFGADFEGAGGDGFGGGMGMQVRRQEKKQATARQGTARQGTARQAT